MPFVVSYITRIHTKNVLSYSSICVYILCMYALFKIVLNPI